MRLRSVSGRAEYQSQTSDALHNAIAMVGALAGGSSGGDGRLGPSPRAESRIRSHLGSLYCPGTPRLSFPPVRVLSAQPCDSIPGLSRVEALSTTPIFARLVDRMPQPATVTRASSPNPACAGSSSTASSSSYRRPIAERSRPSPAAGTRQGMTSILARDWPRRPSTEASVEGFHPIG